MLAAAACSSGPQPGAPSSAPPGDAAPRNTAPIRVLMLTATEGFRHDSIPTAIDVMARFASSPGDITVTSTGQVSSITAASLAGYDVLFFALTSGELPFTAEQKTAILTFVNTGRGFIGVHSATDTLYEWPEYGRLVGGYYLHHPWTQQATVIVEDRSHPSTRDLGESFSILDEFYTFRDNPRLLNVQVLLRLDPGSVGASGGDYPLAWAQTVGSGRAYYNALGHFPGTWNDPRFQQQLVGAIRWVASRN